MRLSWRFRHPAGLLVALLACAGGESTTQPALPPVASVLLTPAYATIQLDGTLQVAAEIRDAANDPVTGAVVTWVSRNVGVATVSPGGLVSGTGEGTTRIVASVDGRSDSVTITVIATWDPDVLGVPRFIARDYIDHTVLARISRFRSGFGHDYSDGVESCRSMKHYFQPRSNVDWSALAIRSPVAGRIVSLQAEMTFGTQVQIVPAGYPAATVIIFHVNPVSGLAVGQAVNAGDTLGAHIGSQTLSDVAIRFRSQENGYRLVSYFEAMADSVFAGYAGLGVVTRDSFLISRADRDASPLQCSGESFTDPGTVENWVDLP